MAFNKAAFVAYCLHPDTRLLEYRINELKAARGSLDRGTYEQTAEKMLILVEGVNNAAKELRRTMRQAAEQAT